MLTLDQTMLFYFFLRDAPTNTNDKDMIGLVNDWAARIPRNTKPRSKCLSDIQSLAKQSFTTDSLSQVSTSSLNKNVKATKDVHIDSVGGLSNHDETIGEEHIIAVKSPLKEGSHVTSIVSYQIMFSYI
jgi:hypothetical protein